MSKFKKYEEKEKRRKIMEEAVCGFANANNTEEACFVILAGIQNISGSRFSSSFIEKVKEVFPTIGDITPPPKNLEEEYYEISSHEDKVLSSLEEKLGPPLQLSCNRSDHSFVISVPKFKIEDFLNLPEWKKAHHLRALRKPDFWRSFKLPELSIPTLPETIEVKLDYIIPDYDGSELDESVMRDLEGKLNINGLYDDYWVSGLDESVIEDMEKQQRDLHKGWTRFNIILLHEKIRVHQESVRGILDSLVFKNLFGQEVKRRRKVDGQIRIMPIDLWLEMLQNYRDFALDLYMNSGELRHKTIGEDYRLFKYLDIYNGLPRPIIEFDQQDNPKERSPIGEEDYFGIDLPLKWLDRIKSDLAYCLIEFLINKDRQIFRKCPYCHHFFVADDIKRMKCYSDDCIKTSAKVKKRKQRDKDPARYL